MLEVGKSRYYTLFFVIFISLLILFPKARAEGDKVKSKNRIYHYYDKLFNKAYNFRPKNREIMVSFSSGFTPPQMRQIARDEGLDTLHFSEGKGFGVYKLPTSAVHIDSVLSKIRVLPGVLSAIPVMINMEGNDSYLIPHEFTVQFKNGVSEKRMREIIADHGCSIVKRQRTYGYYTLSVPGQKMDLEIPGRKHGKALFEIIREFIALKEVEFAEPSFIAFNNFLAPFYPNDEMFVGQWNLNDTGQFVEYSNDPNMDADINAPEAWEIERGDPNVIIVVIDTGVDLNHEDLRSRFLFRGNEDWDFSDGPSLIPIDEVGHGTAVAGIVAAEADNYIGVAGIAHGCRIMPLKVVRHVEVQGSCYQNFADALNYVVEHAKRHPHYRYVVNNSWEVADDHIAIHAAITKVKQYGIFLCAASGNQNLPNLLYPAKYSELIGVGASNPCEERWNPNSCEPKLPGSEGNGSHYGQEIDVVAPGTWISSTDMIGDKGKCEGIYCDSLFGTSGSCPHVAGVAALLFSRYPNLSVEDIEDTIRFNSKDIASQGWDEETGYGKIDALKALSNPMSFIRVDHSCSSDHPYDNDANMIVCTISKSGAAAMRVHFSTFKMHPYSSFDYVILTDDNDNNYGNFYKGHLEPFTSHVIPGDTINIRLLTDANGIDYGFDIDYYEYFVQNVYVDCNASGLEDGTSWENAFTEIQDAIDDSNTVDGSIIWVAEGTYQENIDFKGKSIGLYSLTDPNKTIIDGNDSGSVVAIISDEENVVISGFTLQGGEYFFGGGIYCRGTSPTITNCIIKGNTASYGGGGIYCDTNSSLTITNCTISGNSAEHLGGGFYSYNSSAIISNCTISENSVIDMTSGGGGLYCAYSSLTITNCTISENSSLQHGGGLICYDSQLDITNCTISHNTAVYGGGMRIVTSSPIITNCTIFRNSASGSGGGFSCYFSSPSITNSSFYGNSAASGGAIHCSGGYFCPTITNSILWNDSPQEIYGSPTVTYSDIQGGYTGTGNINEDPLFIDPNMGDFHLQADSNCIDSADPNATGLPSTDLDGNPRVVNGKPDMGVYESMTIYLDPTSGLQSEIAKSSSGSVIILEPGTYQECINFLGKSITIMSTDPDDPNVVKNTIIDPFYYTSAVIFPPMINGTKSVLNGITITGGHAPYGGGIYCGQSSSPTIINCRIVGNTAYKIGGNGGFGGGIFCDQSSNPSVTNCIISDNSAQGLGGGICIDNAWPSIRNCIITENSSGDHGGGLVFAGNIISRIENCTFFNNSSSGSGGGIYCPGSLSQKLEITNCILWGDSPQEIDGNATVTYSDVQMDEGVYPGTGNINTNPLFVDSDEEDYHLQASSPCINAGTNDVIFYPPTDKDNIPRPVGAKYDMGAYEYCALVRHVPNAYSTIQGAINASNDWDVIFVQPGIYFENINTNGTKVTIMSKEPWNPEIVANTIIDGNQVNTVVTFNNGEGKDTVLNGFTIRNGGNASYGGGICCSYSPSPNFFPSSPTIMNCLITGNSSWQGGGIYCYYYSSPDIFNCTITENSCDYYGAGINCYFLASPNIIKCSIMDNSANDDGGGVYCQYSSSPVITDCLIAGNSTNDKGGGIYCGETSSPNITNCTISDNSGGGIYCYSYYSSSPTITNCSIIGNTAISGGGIRSLQNAYPNITNCTIMGNSATSFYGGGISCTSRVSVTNCIISSNYANDMGGGVHLNYPSSSLEIKNCTISNNSADGDYGGGIFCDQSSGSIVNCVITKNSTEWAGGGIYCYKSSSNITNCTISENQAVFEGGGIYSYDTPTPVITNCIVWNNPNGQYTEIAWTYYVPTVTYSDVMGGFSGTGNINADPLFLDVTHDDFHLKTGSPCIDTGTGTGAPSDDRDGVSRPQDGDESGGAQWDMGAYEFVP